MEGLLKMPNKFFTFEEKVYKFKSLEYGELELVSIVTGEILTAQINDKDVFTYFGGEMKSLEEIYKYYKEGV